jgi:hypothetical protein
MQHDSRTSLLARNLASPCLGHEPKARVATRFFISYVLIFYDIKDLLIPLYYGPKNMKSSLSTTTYNPFKDLHERDFLLTCPSKPKVYLVWMGIVHSDVVNDANDEHYRMVHVQWWVPFKKGARNNAKFY